jgi:hypothetical protein
MFNKLNKNFMYSDGAGSGYMWQYHLLGLIGGLSHLLEGLFCLVTGGVQTHILYNTTYKQLDDWAAFGGSIRKFPFRVFLSSLRKNLSSDLIFRSRSQSSIDNHWAIVYGMSQVIDGVVQLGTLGNWEFDIRSRLLWNDRIQDWIDGDCALSEALHSVITTEA